MKVINYSALVIGLASAFGFLLVANFQVLYVVYMFIMKVCVYVHVHVNYKMFSPGFREGIWTVPRSVWWCASSQIRAGASYMYLAMVRPSSSTDFHTRAWRGYHNRSHVYTHVHACIIAGNMGGARLAYVCGWFGSSDRTRHCCSGLAMGIAYIILVRPAMHLQSHFLKLIWLQYVLG